MLCLLGRGDCRLDSSQQVFFRSGDVSLPRRADRSAQVSGCMDTVQLTLFLPKL